MQKSIYAYLQRYLLKVLTIPPYYNTHTSLYAYKINTIKRQKKFLKLHFLRKYTNKNLSVNCAHFYLISNFVYINNKFLKKWKTQKPSCLSFIKMSSITFIYTIKIKTLISKQKMLCKKHFRVSHSSVQLFTVSIQNFNWNIILGKNESVPFYFYNHQALNSFIVASPCSNQKMNSLSALKSFYRFYFFSQNLILNRKKDILYNFFSSAFPLLRVAKVPGLANQYGSQFLWKNLIVLNIFCLVTCQYFKENKIIKNIQYKVYVELFTLLYVYQFNNKNLTKVKIKPFYKKIRGIKQTIHSHYFLMRPLFSLTRFDTFLICHSLLLPLYPDKSNLQVDFLRNRIRKQILPAIRILINPKFDTILCKFNEFYG